MAARRAGFWAAISSALSDSHFAWPANMPHLICRSLIHRRAADRVSRCSRVASVVVLAVRSGGGSDLGGHVPQRRVSGVQASVRSEHWARHRRVSRRQRVLDDGRHAAIDKAASNRLSVELRNLTRRGRLEEVWPHLEVHDRKRIVAAVINRVVIAPATPGRGRFAPDRRSIEWRA